MTTSSPHDLADLRESIARAGYVTNCRECDQRAEFVLWGKMFPLDALGPRCYDHAVRYSHHSMPSRVDQWAVIDLRPILALIEHVEALEVQVERVRALAGDVRRVGRRGLWLLHRGGHPMTRPSPHRMTRPGGSPGGSNA